MSRRIVISSGSEWEPAVGYSRLIRIGDLIEIAGTTAIDGKGRVISPGNPYEQTVFILQKMDEYLKQKEVWIVAESPIGFRRWKPADGYRSTNPPAPPRAGSAPHALRP